MSSALGPGVNVVGAKAALDVGFCWQVTAGTTKRVVFGGRS